jgi:hypothetical protein
MRLDKSQQLSNSFQSPKSYVNSSKVHDSITTTFASYVNSEVSSYASARNVSSSPSKPTWQQPAVNHTISEYSGCWEEWTSFWAYSSSLNAPRMTTLPGGNYLTTFTVTLSEGAVVPGTVVDTFVWTDTETLSANGFIWSTSIATWTDLWTTTNTEAKAGTTVTQIMTETMDIESGTVYTKPSVNVTGPTCSLPTSVSQCQSLWDNYVSVHMQPEPALPSSCGSSTSVPVSCSPIVSNYLSGENTNGNSVSVARPACTQASVNSVQCEFFSSEYFSAWSARNSDPNPQDWDAVPFLSVGYQPTSSVLSNGSTQFYSYWPSSSVIAPGCTLGCGQCAITGGTVRLLYWPVPKTSAIQIPSNDQPMTVFANGTKFVSPTVYISYHNIYASNSCGNLGTTHVETIVPLPDPTDLSSLWANWDMTVESTARFNYADLNTPIAHSVYDRLPQCASWSHSQVVRYKGHANVSTMACP